MMDSLAWLPAELTVHGKIWQALVGAASEFEVQGGPADGCACDHGLKLLNTRQDCLTVVSVGEGPWTEWNNSSSASHALRPHDGIFAVNGVRGDGDRLMDEMRESALRWGGPGGSRVTLAVRRPRRMRVAVRKGEKQQVKKLGLSLLIFDASVIVTEVQPNGLISLWNAANPYSKVREGDRIVEVNGAKGDDSPASAVKLLDLIHRTTTVDMVVESLAASDMG